MAEKGTAFGSSYSFPWTRKWSVNCPALTARYDQSGRSPTPFQPRTISVAEIGHAGGRAAGHARCI